MPSGHNPGMAHRDRLSGLDAAFLDLESHGAHMHVAAIFLFAGEPPGLRRPRGRDRRAGCTSCPATARSSRTSRSARAARSGSTTRTSTRATTCATARCPPRAATPSSSGIAGRLFALPLDRTKPLWEMNLVEGLAPAEDGAPRFAIISKTHHALVDGVSGVDITSVLFDPTPEPGGGAAAAGTPVDRAPRADRRRAARALAGRARHRPGRGPARGPSREPRAARGRAAHRRRPRRPRGDGPRGARPARPPTPLNVPIGPHRRYTWVDADRRRVQGDQERPRRHAERRRAERRSTLALGRWLRGRGVTRPRASC